MLALNIVKGLDMQQDRNMRPRFQKGGDGWFEGRCSTCAVNARQGFKGMVAREAYAHGLLTLAAISVRVAFPMLLCVENPDYSVL